MVHITPSKSGAICEIYFFDESTLSKTLKQLHWKENGNKLVNEKTQENIKCGICKKNLKKENISAFFPGSVKATCMKEECYLAGLHETKKIKLKVLA